MNSKGPILLFGFLLAFAIYVATFNGEVQASREHVLVVEATGDDAADCERPDLPGVFVTQDVCNIQAAVDANPGGTILLRGTFHFAEYGEDGYVVPGTDGTVFITNDIKIKGEQDGKDPLTRIKGGYYTFSIGYSPTEWAFHFSDEVFSSPDKAVPVNATVQGIEFENSLMLAIRIWSTSGSTIRGNKITGGRSLSIEDFFGPGAHGAGVSIMALPPGAFLGDYPDLITGKIHIVDNFIDGMYERADAGDPWAIPSYGVLIRGFTQSGIWLAQYESEVTITGNAVYNVGLTGILSGGNDGTTDIKDNLVHIVVLDPEISPAPEGIQANAGYFYDGYETAKYVIKDNDVTFGGGLRGQGIVVDWTVNSPIVKGNRISLKYPTDVGILLYNVSNATVAGNEIEGVGQYGLVLGFWLYPLFENDGNIVKDNDLGAFTAAAADYYLTEGVTNNLLHIGQDDTLIDDSGNDTNRVIRGD